MQKSKQQELDDIKSKGKQERAIIEQTVAPDKRAEALNHQRLIEHNQRVAAGYTGHGRPPDNL